MVKLMTVSVWAVAGGKSLHYTVEVVACSDDEAEARAIKWALRQGEHVLATTVVSEQPL